MPFHYLLTNLMVDVPGAQGAIFLDPEGEAVEFVTRRATPYELKLEGAYHGIFLRRAARLARIVSGGDLAAVALTGSHMRVMSQRLKEDYYLVLVMDRVTPLSVAREAMVRVSEALNREIP